MDPTFAAFLMLLTSVPGIGPALPYVPLVCGLAALTDVLIPPPPAGSVWVVPRKIIHYLGLNFGYARNALPAGYAPVTKSEDLIAAVEKDVAEGADPVVTLAPTSPLSSAAPLSTVAAKT
jgi:hypothetical protein